jgi:hypothetical protein
MIYGTMDIGFVTREFPAKSIAFSLRIGAGYLEFKRG